MQNPTIYTYLNQDFTAIPLFDGLSVDGVSQGSQADLHLADDFQSPSEAVFYFLNGQWFLECLSGMIEVDGVTYPKNQRVLLNHRSIIHLCDADGHVFRSKFIIVEMQSLEWKTIAKDAFPMGLSSLARIDCAVLSNQLVVRLGEQIIYQDLQAATADPSVSTRDRQNFSHSSLTIAIQDVTVGNLLNRKTILKDIQVEFKPKEMILILGGSGAGKSTFMEAVTGLVYSNTSAYFNGVDLLSDGKKQGVITLAPQSPDEHYRMEDTVYKNLEDAAKLYGPSELADNPELRKEEVLSVLRKLDLESVKGSKCSSLSGGQKKKLTIAMEYITRPEILFMDEPDSGVDGSMVMEVMTTLREITDEGKILCVITHTPDRIRHLFDKVMVVGKSSEGCGRLCYFGSVDNALKVFAAQSLEEIVHKISGAENAALVDQYVQWFENERRGGHAG